MTALTATPRRWHGTPRSDRIAAAAAIALAGLLSLWMVALILSQHGGGIGLALAAVTMTAPVAYALSAPTSAAFTLAAAAAVNEPFLPHLVRCGPALPATFFIAFVAAYALGRRQGLLALAGAAVSIVLQCLFDPRLGASVMALMIPIAVILFGAGLYVRSLAAMVVSLRQSTARLHEQREQTARLAVAADREQLTGHLNHALTQRLEVLSLALDSDGDTRDRFATIERLARQTLDEMRELLGSLRDPPTQPEPGLDDLAEVCAGATTAEVLLTVDGTPRTLPASIELSACRIVEQLLRILPDEPASRVQLHVDVAATGIDINVSGTPALDADLEHIQTLASARAALHGGSVAVTDRPGRRAARVWLPLVTSHG